MERINKTISAGKRTIDVKPLPLEGRPDGFNGAVGEFTFDVNTNKTTLNANESLQLDVKVSGKGNLKLFTIPSVKLPNTLEVYEPEHGESVKTTVAGMQGFISDSYTVVPQFKGSYPINPIAFSYFDPKTEKYTTITSKEFTIEVENGPISTLATTTNSNDAKKQVVLSKDNFKYIKLDANLQSVAQESFFKSALFWSLLGGPFLLIPLFILAGKKRRARLNDVEGKRLRKADKLAKKFLSEAKRSINNPVLFYESLERSLHNYLKANLNIETSEMEKSLISKMLLDRKVEVSTVEDFIGLLKSCEFARYASSSTASVQQDYNKAVEVISNIDKQIQ
jgi:hypothetical protein